MVLRPIIIDGDLREITPPIMWIFSLDQDECQRQNRLHLRVQAVVSVSSCNDFKKGGLHKKMTKLIVVQTFETTYIFQTSCGHVNGDYRSGTKVEGAWCCYTTEKKS